MRSEAQRILATLGLSLVLVGCPSETTSGSLQAQEPEGDTGTVDTGPAEVVAPDVTPPPPPLCSGEVCGPGTVCACPYGIPGCVKPECTEFAHVVCVHDTDCESGVCLQLPEAPVGNLCALICIEDCPPGSTCTQWEVGQGDFVDVIMVCMPRYALACQTCAVDSDCAVAGAPTMSFTCGAPAQTPEPLRCLPGCDNPTSPLEPEGSTDCGGKSCVEQVEGQPVCALPACSP